MARAKRGDLDYRRPLDRETVEAFQLFQRWLVAGCSKYSEFAAAEERTESSVAHLAQRNRWQDRAKAKARQDALDGYGDPAEDEVAIDRLALQVIRSAFQRCAAARERLERKGGEDWELKPQIVSAGAAVSAEELNAVRMLGALRRRGHGGDRTGQHGPATEPDEADQEFERLALGSGQ